MPAPAPATTIGTPATAPGPDGTVVSLLIAGMTCGACAARIERRVPVDQLAVGDRFVERRVPVDQLAVGDRFVERRVPVDQLRVGDRFVVRPGETVAADGIVTSGGAAVDRSAMTGESVPAGVTPGDRVIGGTVAIDGRLVVRATTVGRDTQLAQMVRLVEDAQNQKAAVQRLADRISAVFAPAVLLVAVVTLLGWLLAGGSAGQSCNATLAVLIIACPCALGLAAADLGLAVGSGTDVAINAADLVIVRDDLRVVATAVRLSRRTLATIRGNLAWAFAYNLAAIPLAACGLLDPLVAGAAMALSSAFVVWNSSRLRHCLRRSPAMRTAPAVAPPTPAVVPAGSAPAAPDPAPRAALRSR